MRRDGIQAATVGELRAPRAPAWLDAGRRAALAEAWRALVVSRVLVWAAAAGAVAIWGLSARARAFDPAGVTTPFGAVGDALAAPLGRWDSVWYLAIAGDGYPGAAGPRTAFFPLYPMLVRAAGALVGSALVGGALVSLAAFAVALYLLHRLTELELGAGPARAAVRALALSPMAFFWSAVYSESLFLMLSVGAVYAARTRRWAWAGAAGALAAATRSAGVLLLVPLAVLWLAGRPGAERRVRDAAWLAVVPAGLAAFCAWLALRGGDGLAPFHAQDVWHRHVTWPFGAVRDGAVAAWDGARQLLSGRRYPVYFTQAGGDPFSVARANLMLFGFLLAAVPAVAGTLRRLPLAYGAYVVCALALPLSTPVGPQPLMSLPRFELVLFPLFMWLGAWAYEGGPWRERAVLGVSAAGLVVFTALFATWHWVA